MQAEIVLVGVNHESGTAAKAAGNKVRDSSRSLLPKNLFSIYRRSIQPKMWFIQQHGIPATPVWVWVGVRGGCVWSVFMVNPVPGVGRWLHVLYGEYSAI